MLLRRDERTTTIAKQPDDQEEEEDVCPICLEEYDDSNPAAETLCNHKFHLQCAMEWAQRSDDCPVCLVRPLQLRVQEQQHELALVAEDAKRAREARAAAEAVTAAQAAS